MNTEHDKIMDDPRITAYVLGELSAADRAAFEAELAASAELRAEVAAFGELAAGLGASMKTEACPSLPEGRRAAVLAGRTRPFPSLRGWGLVLYPAAAAAAAAVVCAILFLGDESKNSGAPCQVALGSGGRGPESEKRKAAEPARAARGMMEEKALAGKECLREKAVCAKDAGTLAKAADDSTAGGSMAEAADFAAQAELPPAPAAMPPPAPAAPVFAKGGPMPETAAKRSAPAGVAPKADAFKPAAARASKAGGWDGNMAEGAVNARVQTRANTTASVNANQGTQSQAYMNNKAAASGPMLKNRDAKSAESMEREEQSALTGNQSNKAEAVQNRQFPAPGICNQAAVAGGAANDVMTGEPLKKQAEAKAASAAAAAPVADSATVRKYVVQTGDTLFAIAKALLGDGTRWPEIVKLNPGLTPENLQPGQAIRLPAAAVAEADKAAQP